MLNKNLNKPKCQEGFTLIELLVVMVIIAIIATIGIGSFQSSQIKARDANRKSDLQQIGRALEAYYNDKGQYPTGVGGDIYGCSGEALCDWGEEFKDENDTIYMVVLPTDPRSAKNYYYESDGTYYQIYTKLENDLDRDINKNGSNESLGYSGTTCDGIVICNYGISSSNITPSDGGATLITY